MSHRPSALAALGTALLLTLAACGSSDSGGGANDATTTTAAAATTTTEAPAEPLEILVSNDDGYSAEGIATLVTALQELDGVEVTVVAPLDQQSGTGGKSTEGELAVTDVELADGVAAQAVDGFPADTIRVAIDEQGLTPDLVVAGINEGQNVGPFIDVSGTVGAARAAVARGIPALATSQGTGDVYDYDAAVPFIVEWVEEHREAILAGDEPVAVTNLNVPSCATGEVRGLAEVDPDPKAEPKAALGRQDCASTAPLDEAAGDVAALNSGWATISTVPDAPT